jgi:isopentenyl diphosphate isomerase/L-lactate dehydrogenase-like FMN-dependent dehydrogenase
LVWRQDALARLPQLKIFGGWRAGWPSPIFDYIDGAADDEVTYRRNTASLNNVTGAELSRAEAVDLSVTAWARNLRCRSVVLYGIAAPFHYQGELAVAAAAAVRHDVWRSSLAR